MINTVKTSFFLLLVIALSACNDSSKLETIRQAEMLMQEQPDSALRVLQTINRHSLHGEPLARYALIYSIAQDKSGQDVTNDSLLRIAHEYYSQHPDDSLYARSQYYMGKYLWLTAQTDSAYACLLKAKNTSEEERDYYTAYLATDRMRRIAEVSDSALCLKLAKEAYHFYVKHGGTNPANESYLLIGIGESYRRRRDSDSTLYYYNKALDKATLSGDSIAIGSVIQNIAFHFLHYKQYDTALDYANKSLSYQKTFNKSLLKLMALCYIQKSEYEVAQQYINALPSNASKEDQLVKLGMLHRLCAKTGDADATQEYFDSACNVAADMYLSTLKEKLELHRKNLHEALERQRVEYQRTIFVICFLFSVALIILISWLFIKYHRAKKAEIEHQKIQNRSLEELNKKEEERFRAEKARLLAEEAMLRKEKEQKEQIMERTRFYVKSMVSILREVEQYRTEQKKQKEKDKQNNYNSKNDHKEEARLELKLDDKAWAEIQAYLEVCEGSFVTRFKEKYPDISDSDFRLCMLLRCGFSNPELEQVYSIAAQSVKTRQLFLKDKLGLEDKTISLRQYIKQF